MGRFTSGAIRLDPIVSVSQLYPPAALIGPLGQVRLRTSNLVFGQQNLEGNATLEWQGAGETANLQINIQ